MRSIWTGSFSKTRIEAKPFEFGARDEPKPHTADGFVLCAFGELSNSSYSLSAAIARVGAARVVGVWKMPPKHALALCKQKILRFWALTAPHGWARFTLGHFRDLVLSPGDHTAATREPDTASHEHRIFFFKDTMRGTSSTADFGWRGGSGV